MFDILDALDREREIKAHNKEWIIVKALHFGYCLAYEKGDELPATIRIIYDDKWNGKINLNEGA